MSYQWAKTIAELARAQYHHQFGGGIIFPVKISRPSAWLIPYHEKGISVLVDVGVKAIDDIPLGTWLDIFLLVKKGDFTLSEPLVKQVQPFTFHEGKRYTTTKL